MRGRKPVPTSLKLLRNNPGKRRIRQNEPQPALLIGEPPASLTGEAVAEWRRRAPQLSALGLLTDVDQPAMIAYCRAWARYVKAEAKVEESGEVVKTSSGHPIQNPYLAIANKALKQCTEFWAEFAMMPSSRSRVSVSPSGAKQSNVDRFMAEKRRA